MDKMVVIHQPDFLPYIGFFHRLLHAGLYVILDNVQFVRSSRSWHRRDKIKTEQGEKWLSVAVRQSSRDAGINSIMLCEEKGWRRDHLRLIRHNYRGAPFFDQLFPHVEKLYGYDCLRMIDFNLASIHMLMELFDIQIPEIMASCLSPAGSSNELLVDILGKVGANVYLSGIGARDYFQPGIFEQAGIRVEWQNFQHPVYRQQYSGFIPYLSSIDLFFNCGIESSREILRKECDAS